MTQKMCDSCGEAPAIIHMKEIGDKETTDLDLCRRCAEKRGYSVSSPGGGAIQDLAEKLVSMAKEVSGRREVEGVRCAICGLFYSEFSKTGRLGCPDCYEAFIGQLKPILRKTHGSVNHTGRRPNEDEKLREDRKALRRLRADLERAVRREDYERAAELRDEIQKLEDALRTRTTGSES